jgi:hypothetical protein
VEVGTQHTTTLMITWRRWILDWREREAVARFRVGKGREKLEEKKRDFSIFSTIFIAIIRTAFYATILPW